jgi:hypothetical protein
MLLVSKWYFVGNHRVWLVAEGLRIVKSPVSSNLSLKGARRTLQQSSSGPTVSLPDAGGTGAKRLGHRTGSPAVLLQ